MSKKQTEAMKPHSTRLNINRRIIGDRAHITLTIPTPQTLNWKQFTQTLKKTNPNWTTPSGTNTLYHQTHPDLLTCINITRGTKTQIWLTSEPPVEQLQELENEIHKVYLEIKEAIVQSQTQ
jgi:SSS family solute:Na+ symporter